MQVSRAFSFQSCIRVPDPARGLVGNFPYHSLRGKHSSAYQNILVPSSSEPEK
jgi:hypothetical protein